MPDLAPYEEDYCVDPLGGLDFVRSEFIRAVFSKSFYSEACGNSTKPVIKVIYYWPGQRVELPCAVCHMTSLFNGQIKNWAHLPGLWLSRHIVDLDRSWMNPNRAHDPNQWIVLSHEYGKDLYRLKRSKNCESWAGCYDPIQMPSRDSSHLPWWKWENSVANKILVAVFGCEKCDSAYLPRQEKPYVWPYNEPRPNTSFIQRDGKLIIQTADADAYGLYRCFDQQTKDRVRLVYFLIPIMPMYFRDNLPEKSIHQGECGIHCKATDSEYPQADACYKEFLYPFATVQKCWDEMSPDLRKEYIPNGDHINLLYHDQGGLPVIRGEYAMEGDSSRFYRFDTFHRFHFLPPNFASFREKPKMMKSVEVMDDFCQKAKSNNTYCIEMDIGEYKYNEKNDVIAPIYRGNIKQGLKDTDFVNSLSDFNLVVGIHWTNWTSCNGQDKKTRKGYCVLKKLDPYKKWNEQKVEKGKTSIFRQYRWIQPIHSFLENVDEFKENGFRLHRA